MKSLGLVGAGIGGASLVAPVFHDVDELISSPISKKRLPWYVTERAANDLTTEYDLALMTRWNNVGYGGGWAQYPEAAARQPAAAAAGTARRNLRYSNDEPGYDLKWRALSAGAVDMTAPSMGYAGFNTATDYPSKPSDLGKPKWTGTPEEASRLLMAAMRFFGGGEIGFADIDTTIRTKISWNSTTQDGSNNVYVYDNVDKGVQRTVNGRTEYVVPNKSLSLVSFNSPQCPEMRQSNSIRSNTNTPTYRWRNEVRTRTTKFLHALGEYQFFGNFGDQNTYVNTELAMVLTGLGECSRQSQYVNSLVLGPNHNSACLQTDLVLAPTLPIDAGMWRFCWGCAICAKQCPSNSISLDKEPTYEIPLTFGKPTVAKRPGPKQFWTNMVTCYLYYTEFDGCAPKEVLPGDYGGGRSCYAVCPFGGDRAAMAHTVIKATMATTTVFNSFMASMAEVFGTGREALHPDDWWDMQLPVYNFAGNVGATKVRWKMQ